MFSPKHISPNHSFTGSVFCNRECEIILRNIVLLQINVNPNAWTPFTWEDYNSFCDHNVTESERGVLNCFVNGGKSVLSTSTSQEAGWLALNDGAYSFTEKMINMLVECYPFPQPTPLEQLHKK